MLHIVICIKHVCVLFDSEQSKKTRVQTTGASAIVNTGRKNLINYSTKTVNKPGTVLCPASHYGCSHQTASNGRRLVVCGAA
ncbi:hypothetical protein EIC82_17560 [Enterobacter sp. A11]|nr:hypothetical protein EIC82_17560 [Enterobacter sp. A11]